MSEGTKPSEESASTPKPVEQAVDALKIILRLRRRQQQRDAAKAAAEKEAAEKAAAERVAMFRHGPVNLVS